MSYPSELEAAMKAVKERFDQQEKRIAVLEQPGSKDPYRVAWLEQRIGILEGRIADMEQSRDKRAFAEHEIKSQAAQQQAQGNINTLGSGLYAPLRSDTKPLLEMAALMRKLAMFNPDVTLDLAFSALIREAREILKRST